MRHALPRPRWERIEELSVFSLIAWGRDNETPCRALLYDLKESQDLRLFRFWSREWVRRLPPDTFHNAVLVPVPSSTGRLHSFLLARCLAETTGLEMVEALALGKEERQPGKSRRERMKRRLRLKEGVDLLSYKSVLLIDDVTTSGATLLGCKKALRGSQKVAALTVFRREPSA